MVIQVDCPSLNPDRVSSATRETRREMSAHQMSHASSASRSHSRCSLTRNVPKPPCTSRRHIRRKTSSSETICGLPRTSARERRLSASGALRESDAGVNRESGRERDSSLFLTRQDVPDILPLRLAQFVACHLKPSAMKKSCGENTISLAAVQLSNGPSTR